MIINWNERSVALGSAARALVGRCADGWRERFGRVGRTLDAAARRSIAVSSAAYVLSDQCAGWRARLGRGGGRSGRRHARLGLDESLAYIEGVFRDYLRHAGTPRFWGRVAEIGPGDNLGVALLILAAGAEEVHVVDRFHPERDERRQDRIYAALAERFGLRDLFSGPPSERMIEGVVRHYGEPAELFFRDCPETFDLIVSCAVLEHLYDPIGALADMARALRPGGRLIHEFDLRPHALYKGHHPLTFLTIPSPVYRRMVRHTGRPNRVMLPAYRRWLEGSGLEGQLLVTVLAGEERPPAPASWPELPAAMRARAVARVEEIRPRLWGEFRAMAPEDLAVAGCVLVARKPRAWH